MPGKRGSLRERFERHYIPEPNSGCWLWLSSIVTPTKGYGSYGLIGNPDWRSKNRQLYAHRVSYELHVGEIPAGHDIDHNCRNTLCVNPDHLQPRSKKDHRQVSWDRILKGNCKRGHTMDDRNTWIEKTGARHCRKCHADREAAKRAKAKLICEEVLQ